MRLNLKPTLLAILCLFNMPREMEAINGYLTEDEITLFYQQGYFIKKGCLNSDELENLVQGCVSIVDRSLQEISLLENVSTNTDQFIHIDGSKVVFKENLDQSRSIIRINGCAGMVPELLNTMRSEKMINTFFDILGTNDIEHLICQFHPKLPGDGVSFPKHRDIQFRKSFDPDWQDILGNGSYAICIIPIDPMSKENGGLWVDRNNYPEPNGEEENLAWIEAQPGDLLFMHPYLTHGSGPNFSPSKSRKTLLTGFCAFGANHKAYPGALINTRLTLNEAGEIEISKAPWSETSVYGTGSGH